MSNKIYLTTQEIKNIDVGRLSWDYIKSLSYESLIKLRELARREASDINASIVCLKAAGKDAKKAIIRKAFVDKNLSSMNGHIKVLNTERNGNKNDTN